MWEPDVSRYEFLNDLLDRAGVPKCDYSIASRVRSLEAIAIEIYQALTDAGYPAGATGLGDVARRIRQGSKCYQPHDPSPPYENKDTNPVLWSDITTTLDVGMTCTALPILSELKLVSPLFSCNQQVARGETLHHDGKRFSRNPAPSHG